MGVSSFSLELKPEQAPSMKPFNGEINAYDDIIPIPESLVDLPTARPAGQIVSACGSAGFNEQERRLD